MFVPEATSFDTSKNNPADGRLKGLSGAMPRTGFMLLEMDKQLIRDNSHTVREALFACTTRQQVECAVAFARYLSFAGLNNDNYWVFLRLVMTNNPWVVDELLHDRIPKLLFSTIMPDRELLDAAFEMLFSRHPDEIYEKSLESVLGIIQNAYFDPDDGYRIRRLSIMDINALGKHLVKDKAQDFPLNRMILEILDRIAQVGEYYGEQDKSVISKHAFNVRYAYFDHTRELIDAIPEPLLVRMNDVTGVPPEEDFANLVSNRRQVPRDIHGRFIKTAERVEEGPIPETKSTAGSKAPSVKNEEKKTVSAPGTKDTPKVSKTGNAGKGKPSGKK